MHKSFYTGTMKGVVAVICILIGSILCDQVNISFLNVDDAHTRSFVNISSITTDPLLQEMISYSGYITVDPLLSNHYNANYFFWFFEATQSSKSGHDIPVVIWLQGGPGCSSLLGLFLENGPFRVNPESLSSPLNEQLSTNPFSWNNEFHMLFVDNPVGSGFSYGDTESYVRNSYQMATYLENVVSQFMLKFPEYQPNPFYVFGESFSGKTVPAFSSNIMKKSPPSSINFSGFGVGNGFTDPYNQITTQADVLYYSGFIDAEQANSIRANQERIREYIEDENFLAAYNERQAMNQYIGVVTGGINIYDSRTYENVDYSDIVNFVNQPEMRELIHVGDHTFNSMCDYLTKGFLEEDILQSFAHLLPELLDNYPGLFYQGQFDLADGVSSVEAMLDNLGWDGVPGYQSATRQIWYTNGKVGGMTKKYLNLYQCTVVGAGHLVPYDQPETSLDMVKRFIYNTAWN